MTFLLIVLTTATQSATAAQLTPGRSPFSIGADELSSLLRHARQWVDDASAVLPAEERGSGSGAHSTRADAGAGRAPGKGAGQLAVAGGAAQRTTGGKSATVEKGFNAKTSKRLPSKSSAYATWWQNADGTETERVSQSVVNYKDSSGGWQPINTSLTKAADGRWQVSAAGYGLTIASGKGLPGAETSALELGSDPLADPLTASDSILSAAAEPADATTSDGGSSTGTLATLTVASGESVSWSLQGAASVTGSESGDTVTYPSILPDTDLSLSSEPSGVKEALVLDSASAPNTWTFPLTLTGLTLSQASDGTWQLVDSSGDVAATLGSPFALDSSNTAAAETQDIAYSLATVDGVEELTMTLSASWLADPARVFPVTVDPTITVSTAGSSLSSYVDDEYPTQNYSATGVLNVGNDGTGVDRAFINFPSSVITSDLQDTGFHITSAQFAAYMASGSTSSSYPFNVYSVAQSWSASKLTWSDSPSTSIQQLGTYGGSASSAATCPELNNGYWLYTPLSASDMDTFAINQYSWQGVMVTAGSEANASYFRVFGSASNGACSPYLSLTYTPDVMPTVSTMSPSGGSVLPSLTPELTASGTDPDNWPDSSVEYEFEIFSTSPATKNTPATMIAHSSLLSSGSWSVPTGTLTWGNQYLWSVCVWDGFECATQSYNAFETATPGPVLTQDLSQSTSGHGFDVATGNYTTSATDADVAGIGPELSVERDYNSLDTRQSGGFGAEWSSMVDATATQELDTSGNLIGVAVTYPDGSVVVFGYNSSGKNYSAPEGRFATLLPITSSGSLVVGYTLTDKTGTTYTFGHVTTAAVPGSTAGVFGISQVADAVGRALTFLWGVTNGVAGAHVLLETNVTTGRTLSFTWTTPSGALYPHVSVVTTSLADSTNTSSDQYWSYGYSGDQLSEVCAPNATNSSVASSSCTRYNYQQGSDYQQAVLNTSPYQYWPMDDTTGNSTSLSMVGANIGTGRAYYSGGMTSDTVSPTGPTVRDGSTAAGSVFNGSTSFMTLPTGIVLNSTYLSVGLWFKTTSNGPLFSEQNVNITGTPQDATMSLYVGTDGYLRGGWYTGTTGSAGQIIDTKAPVDDGAWHYVILAGAGSTQTMYVDGVAVGSLSGTIDNLGQTYEYVGAGYSSGAWPDQAAVGYSYFKGSISDVSMYKSAVSSTEAASLYAAGDTSIDWLQQVIRPDAATNAGESASASVTYNTLDARVTSVTDANGATWGLSDPAVAGSSQVFRETVMSDKPAFYYRLADAAGSTYAADEVNADAWANEGLAASYNDVTLGSTPNVFNDADVGTFDGSSSYLQTPDDLTANAPVSIGLWFNAAKGTSGPLWSEQNTGISGKPSAATNELYVGTNGLLYGSFSMGSQTAIASKDKVNDGNWHYAVLTASATSESLYVDGTLEGSESGTYTYDGQGVGLIGAGYSSGDWQNQGTAGNWYFTGSISDAALFYSQLSQAQVTQLWQAYGSGLGSLVPLESITVTNPADTYDGSAYADTYEFDPANSMREVKYVSGSTGGATTYSYDTSGYLNAVTDPDGDQTITGYDVRGNVVSTTTCQYQALNECSTSYDTYYPDDTTASFTAATLSPEDDQVLTSRDGRSASASDSTYETKYTYDGYGDVLTKTDPSGDGVTNVYTNATSQFACAYPTSSTPTSLLGQLSTTQYAPTELLYTSTTTGGAMTTYAYYPDGDTCMVEDPDHLVTFFVYDGLGRISEKVVEGGETILTGMLAYTGVQKTTYVYDGQGRVAQTTAPTVTDEVSGDPHTAVTTNTYDADGNVTSTAVSDSTGGDAPRITTYQYNDNDQRSCTTSPDGNTSLTVAELSSQPITCGSTYTVHYTYDAWGNVETQTDALTGTATRTTEHKYNGADQLVETALLNTAQDGTYSAGSTLITDTKTYDVGGRLSSDEDAEGFYTCYYYYDNNLLYQEIKTSTSCPASSVSSGQGDVVDTQVISTEYYDGAGNVTRKLTNNGVTETDYSYNPDGTVATTTVDPTSVDPTGVDRITAYSYNADGDVTETRGETDASGVLDVVSDVKQTYDAMGNVMTKTVIDGSTSYETIYTLDQRGLPTQTEDPAGNITFTLYDAAGRLVQTTTPSVPVTVWCQTATSYPVCTTAGVAFTEDVPTVTSVGYDTFGEKVETENADGQIERITYDADGNKTSVTLPSYTAPAPVSGEAAGTPTNSETTYQYNADGELTAQSDPIAVASSNAKGEQTTYAYTMFGTVATEVGTDLATGTAATTSYSYDADARKIDTVTAISSGRSVTTGTTYDYLNRVLTTSVVESDPTDGTSGSITYKTSTNLYGRGGWLATTSTDEHAYTQYGYDNAGDKISSTTALGETKYGYDGAGRLTTTTLPDESYTQVAYDEAGLETSTATYSSANVQLSGTTMSYDADARLQHSYVQTPGQAAYNGSDVEMTTYNYDATGLLTSEVAPLTGPSTVTISYGYDAAGNQTSYTDGNVATTYSTYNPWGLVEMKVVPATSTDTTLASRTTTTSYDADGRAILVSEPVATSTSTPVTIASTYDGFGDLTSQTSSGAEGTNTTRTFTYDLTGLVTSATTENSSGTVLTSENYQYDDRGDLTSVSGAAGGTSSFTYDGDGLMLSRTDASGTTSYTYNYSDDLLKTLNDAATGTTLTYSYNDLGQVGGITYGTGDTRTFVYNAAHEVASDTLATASGTTVDTLTYGWDTDGDLTSKTDSSGTANTYTYDASGRLATWSNGTTLTSYAYDADSNRKGVSTETISSGKVTSDEALNYDARDELTGTTDSVTTASTAYTYTPRGTVSQISTVSATGATGTTAYADDAFGQQTSAGSSTYTYDALGRLTTETTGAKSTALQYSGMADDVASDGTNTYSRDPDGDLIGTADATAGTSGLLWTDLHTDVVGEFSAASTALSGTETYNPLGQVTSSAGTTAALTVGYQSDYTDAATGDVNMAARWYNPVSGQFTSTDSVENSAVPDTANANPFAYADGSPLDGTDPTGHMFSVYLGFGENIIGSMQAVNEQADTLAFNNAVTTNIPKLTVEQLVSADAAYRRAQTDAQSVVDAEKKPVTIGTSGGGKLIGPGGLAGTLSALQVNSTQVQLAKDEAEIGNLIQQYADTDATTDTTQTCNGNPMTWLGCGHNAAAWVGNNSIVRTIVSAAAGLVVAGTCLVGTIGTGSVGCAALGGAAATGLNYVLTSEATGKGSVEGLAISTLTGGIAGAVTALTAGAASELVAGVFGDSAAGSVATSTVTGAASGSAGGAAYGGGNYLAGCGSSCSFSGLASATGTGAAIGGATGGILGTAGSVASASSTTAVADEDAAASSAEDDPSSCPVIAHSFTGNTAVLMANGSVKPIDEIKVGDEIENSAPGKTGTQNHKVDAVIVTHTDHDFVNVTIKPTTTLSSKLAKTAVTLAAAAAIVVGTHATGSPGHASTTHSAAAIGAAATLTTTYHHPFYDVTQGAFVQAQYLNPGDQLQTPTGTAQITDIHLYHATTTTYDLTIDSLHTYYVVAGSTPVLVHNCDTAPSRIFVVTPGGEATAIPVFDNTPWPDVTDNGLNSIANGNGPIVNRLNGGPEATALQKLNRNNAQAGLARPDSLGTDASGRSLTWEEFPPAASYQGGSGATVRLIDRSQNSSQGSTLKNWLNANGVGNGNPYYAWFGPLGEPDAIE